MKAGQWQLPLRIGQLIESGFWPRDAKIAMQQNLKSLVTTEALHRFAPEEYKLYLIPPPFLTVRQLVNHGEDFWYREEAHPNGISFDHAVVIGDFGLGSDAPIILDYRENIEVPLVKRLKWGNSFPENRWIMAAPDFDTMCVMLGFPGEHMSQ
jgi:hypothetical protein